MLCPKCDRELTALEYCGSCGASLTDKNRSLIAAVSAVGFVFLVPVAALFGWAAYRDLLDFL
jgi:predicted amidophosphoribosyltransferase